MKEEVSIGKIEIKCHKCNTFNIIDRSVLYREKEKSQWIDKELQKSDNIEQLDNSVKKYPLR